MTRVGSGALLLALVGIGGLGRSVGQAWPGAASAMVFQTAPVQTAQVPGPAPGESVPAPLAPTVLAPAAPVSPAQTVLQIVVTGPARPGDVVVVRAHGPAGMDAVEGAALGQVVRFHPEADGQTWLGLLGVDLDVVPGAHAVSITGSGLGSPVASGRYDLTVTARRFATRRLRVDSRFVEPPSSEEARIVEEAARLTGLFAGHTPRRWLGPFRTPLAAAPNSNFGTRSLFNGEPRNPHAGVDFPGPTGAPIAAPNAGTVVLAEDLYFTGQTVILDHGLGLYSLYAHLSRLQVAQGDEVSQGQRLGLLGATGRVTGPHLHWAVRLNGARVDPMSLVTALSRPPATPIDPPRPKLGPSDAPGRVTRPRTGGL